MRPIVMYWLRETMKRTMKAEFVVPGDIYSAGTLIGAIAGWLSNKVPQYRPIGQDRLSRALFNRFAETREREREPCKHTQRVKDQQRCV